MPECGLSDVALAKSEAGRHVANRQRERDKTKTAPGKDPLARAAGPWYDPYIIMGKNPDNAARDVARRM